MTIPSLLDSLTPTQNAVRAQFASRPTLESVTLQLLTAAINEKYPALNSDLSHTRLATPYSEGSWSLPPLMSRVMDYLASGTAQDLGLQDTGPHYLADETGNWLGAPSGRPDMKVIEALIKALSWSVPVGLQNALSDYWAEESDTGASRWGWFSDVLKDTLSIGALRQSDLSEFAREIIDQVIQCPEREQRIRRYSVDAVHVYYQEITLTSNGSPRTQLSPALLLVSARLVLLCQPDGQVMSFASLDEAIRYETQRLGERYLVDEIGIKRYEPDTHIFDTQAAIILSRQLDDLGALQLPASIGLKALQAVCQELTDPAHAMQQAPQISRQTLDAFNVRLPDWLREASAGDQALYRQYSLALARAKKNSQGQTFLTGIADLRTFAADALQQQMKRDRERCEQNILEHIPGELYLPDDIELAFLRVAGYPGTVGIVEPVTMSLTDLALKNLVGRPQGSLTVRHRLGWTLPAWLTADYITRPGGLIEQVDVGRVYPETLKSLLLSQTPDALKRETLFADQVSVQLPLQALELSIKQENGLTPLGACYVAALMQREPEWRKVEGVPVVIRHLALVRKPGALADVVSNMFIIEPEDISLGPHLLYRPFYSQVLHEFSSRAALLQAIATEGELQASVLIWLSDRARPIYANGGFQEPHYVRFGFGSDFSPIEQPSPATLSEDGASTELLQFLQHAKLLEFLYGSNARALVSQADKDSVSNSESRWDALLEGGGLIFNTLLLLPFLRGPIMLSGGLFSLIEAASQDIPALNSADPIVREQATVDALLNLGMLLFQLAPSVRPEHSPMSRETRAQVLRSPVPVRVDRPWGDPVPKVVSGSVALAGELPGATGTTLDFSFASAHNRLTPSQRMQLSGLQVTPTEPLPAPMLNGVYVINRQWHALVEGKLYRVKEQAGGELVIVDPHDIDHRGPSLQWSNGQWSLDLRLRLRGGMAPKRIAALRQKNAQRKSQLQTEFADFFSQQEAQQYAIDRAESAMENAPTAAQRVTQQQRYETDLQQQTTTYQLLLDSNKERIELQIPISPGTVAILMENTVNNARKFVVFTELDRKAHNEQWRGFRARGSELEKAIAADLKGYPVYIKGVVEINERSIRWLELKDRYLDELHNLGGPGAERLTRLTSDRPVGEISLLCVKGMQLHALVLPCIKTWGRTLPESLSAVLNPLQEQVRTHDDLSALDFSASEHLEVLDSLVEHYGKGLDALQGIGIVNADELEHSYFDKLLKLVGGLYQNATQQLATEIKPTGQPRKKKPKQALSPGDRSQKRVIKTRKRGQLIGQTKPPGEEWGIEVVEIRSEDGTELLSTYSRHGDVWDEISGVQPTEPPPVTRALSVIKGEARKRFSQLNEHLSRAEGYKKVSRFPQELEEVLSHEAGRLDQLATELHEAIQAQPESARLQADQELVVSMRGGSEQLRSKGKQLRIQLSFELPPTHGNLQYLIDQDLVQMASLGKRVPLRGERRDFIQEYAIEKKGGAPLWYAHFHYAAPDTPKQNYGVAHLKTREQRKQSYYSLLAETQNPQATISVHHGLIGKDLAERWFLPLVP